MYYTGIGSRNTPDDVLFAFERLSEWLAIKGYILRSGHADGADSAFERGCDKVCGKKEIYLPWKNFGGSDSPYILRSNDEAVEIARKFHPSYNSLTQDAAKLQARNSYQVLGYDLSTPSQFIVCWTRDGLGAGGTGQAIRIAKHYNIPIFDFGNYEELEEAKKNFNIFFKNIKGDNK